MGVFARYYGPMGEGICRICLSLNLNTGVNIAKFVSKNCKYAKKSHERTENVLNFLHAKDSFCTEWTFLRVLTRTQRFLLHRMGVFMRIYAHVFTCQRCLPLLAGRSYSKRALETEDAFCTRIHISKPFPYTGVRIPHFQRRFRDGAETVQGHFIHGVGAVHTRCSETVIHWAPIY